VEAAAARSVPPAVRELVTAELSTWDGRPPGLSRSWADGPVRRLSTQDQSAARLALLVAKASYQVDDDVVAAYETTDAGLVELVSWAGLAAARRAGTWLAGQGPAARAA
ncbi:MAG: carboxymuconolactone decarboxylase family protein, partial [Actinophytocola sp.]